MGKDAAWTSETVQRTTDDYFVITDPDLDLTGVPTDMLEVMREGIEKFNGHKCGLSLEIKDLPDDFPLKHEVVSWESNFWQHRVPEDGRFFRAAIDTTFALYRRRGKGTRAHFRIDRPYTARHMPWYLTAQTANDLSDEYLYYLETKLDARSAWGNALAKKFGLNRRGGGLDLRRQLLAHNSKRCLFGQPVQQSHATLLVIEQLLRSGREIHWVHEIGTATGAMSLFWAVHCFLNAIPFTTIDISQRVPARLMGLLKTLGTTVLTGNCFAQEYKETLQRLLKPGLLFCDGGDKRRELKELATVVPSQTLVLLHDYGHEVFLSDIQETEHLSFVEPWNKQSLELETKLAILRRA